mgnify:FL=1
MNTETLERTTDINTLVADLSTRAKTAAQGLAMASGEQRNLALTKAAEALRRHMADLLRANAGHL